jgi:hypothetical protein|tara:strand:- start:1323 stop:1637 length:315 start_codon:yes stop_codon:yes gene_type:complete
MNLPEINQETFFKVGIFCFAVIGLANIGNYFYTLEIQNIFSSIVAWAGIVFNFALMFFFLYLYKQTSINIENVEEFNDLDALMEEMNKQDDKKRKLSRKNKERE